MDIRLPAEVQFTTDFWGDSRLDFTRESLANIF